MRPSHYTLGKNIRELRKGKNLTLKRLAYLTGVSISVLDNLERGIGIPSCRYFSLIEQALGGSGVFLDLDLLKDDLFTQWSTRVPHHKHGLHNPDDYDLKPYQP